MLSPFVIICVAIPICGFLNSYLRDRRYIKKQQADFIRMGIRHAKIRRKRERYMARRLEKNASWRMRNGHEIKLVDMTDNHLANAMRMVARSHHKSGGHYETLFRNKSFDNLLKEGKRRGFKVSSSPLPVVHNNKVEYVEIYIPNAMAKISHLFFSSDHDSRMD